MGPTDSVWRALGPCRRAGHAAASMRGWMAARSSALFKRRSRRRAVWNTFLDHTKSHCEKMAVLNQASVSKYHFPKLNLPSKLQPIHSPVEVSRICRPFSKETWQLLNTRPYISACNVSTSHPIMLLTGFWTTWKMFVLLWVFVFCFVLFWSGFFCCSGLFFVVFVLLFCWGFFCSFFSILFSHIVMQLNWKYSFWLTNASLMGWGIMCFCK